MQHTTGIPDGFACRLLRLLRVISQTLARLQSIQAEEEGPGKKTGAGRSEGDFCRVCFSCGGLILLFSPQRAVGRGVGGGEWGGDVKLWPDACS